MEKKGNSKIRRPCGILCARNLQFEEAAYLRDQIKELEQHYGKATERQSRD
ncbi:MAG: UvrB/UvrC motif-containing protein [Candidatus Omnitrophica bacterium]|nr:UvrB/UvrC motif-containing protein [Candidatus Omnitrophota bacterium]